MGWVGMAFSEYVGMEAAQDSLEGFLYIFTSCLMLQLFKFSILP